MSNYDEKTGIHPRKKICGEVHYQCPLNEYWYTPYNGKCPRCGNEVIEPIIEVN
jgi:hypothetical protein